MAVWQQNLPMTEVLERGAGPVSDIEIQPLSRTGQFMEGMRSSMRNSRPMQALSNSQLSRTIQASEGAARANNGLWRATQFIEASPVLRTTGKVVGRGAIVVGIVLDGISIASAYNEEGGFGDKRSKLQVQLWVVLGVPGWCRVRCYHWYSYMPGVGTVDWRCCWWYYWGSGRKFRRLQNSRLAFLNYFRMQR